MQLIGHVVEDSVIATAAPFLTGTVDILLFESIEGTDPAAWPQGLFGLNPFNNGDDYRTPSVLHGWNATQTIPAIQLGFYFGVNGTELTVGGIDEAKINPLDGYKGSEQIDNAELQAYFLSADGQSLSMNLRDIAYGADSFDNEQADADGKAYIEANVDLNSAFIRLPADMFSQFQEFLGEEAICSTEICYFPKVCSEITDGLEPLNFKFDSHQYFVLHGYDYVFDGTLLGAAYEKACIVGVALARDESTDDSEGTLRVVLGQAFLKNFYTTFDYDNQGITFSLHTESTALIVPNKLYNLTEGTVITLLVLVILAALLSFGYLGYQFFPRKSKKTSQQPLLEKTA